MSTIRKKKIFIAMKFPTFKKNSVAEKYTWFTLLLIPF